MLKAFEDDSGEMELELWLWDSVEKKWSWGNWDFNHKEDDLVGLVENAAYDDLYIPIEEFRKWKVTDLGTKATGKAVLLYGEGVYEHEDDYDVVSKPFRVIAIANINLTKRKFTEVRKMIQNFVKAGGYTVKSR